ncbi:MAG: FtsX-like permease family protein, partial [bacterium]
QAVAASLPDSVRREERPRGQTGVRVKRGQDFLSPRERRAVQVLFAAVGALLLIACANLANLLLARALARQREFAVRCALGAGRGRIMQQVLAESVSLALAGGVLGVGVAWLALRVIVALRPPALDHLADVRLDPAVLLWCLGVSVATGILFGSAPALFAGAQVAGDVLRRETRGGSQGRTSRRVRSALMVLEIAASLVLLVGSGLLVRSFTALQRMPLGFEPHGLVYADVLLGGRPFRDRRVEIRDAIVGRLRSLPGVTGVAIGVMPGKAFVAYGGLEAETDNAGHTTHVPLLGTVFITRDYFQVARIAVVEGRLPDSSIVMPTNGPPLGMSPEVLVNREFARRVWPHGRPIGARVREAGGFPAGRIEPWSTVVGVVDDTRMPEVHGDVAAVQVYSLVPRRLGDVPIIVRTAMSGDASAPMIKHAIASVHPAVFVRPTLSGDTYLRNGLAPTRFAMALITVFAVLAVVLAAVGLYGVIAYGVSQRTREIGVRVALGAEPNTVMRLVVGGGVRLAAAGVVIGVAVAIAVTRVLESMLYAVSPADPLTFGAVVLLITAIALLASYVPARRALRIDPADALRAD